MKKKLVYLWRFCFWNVNRTFCFLWLRPKFNIEIRDSDQRIPKRPFIMVANHGTFFDPWIVGHLTRYPTAIMMNEEGFRTSRFVRWYLQNIGAYPKKKGESDIRAMKLTLTALKDGYPVLIFPEGQTTWDGESQPIFSGIESIVKRSQLPLVLVNVAGNFMSRPWWSESWRRGLVILRRQVLSAEQIARMDKSELRDLIIAYVRNNDLLHPELLAVPFQGPPATQGLERFVWMCRSCGKEDCIESSSDRVSCTACGAAWIMDTHFRFTPVSGDDSDIWNLHDWSSWHKEMVRKNISNAARGDVLACNTDVHQCTVTDTGAYPIIAKGSLALTSESLTFVPDDGGEVLSLSVEEIHDYVFQRKTIFECRCRGAVYKFRFEHGSPMKWVFYLRYLNNYAECESRGYI